jgi:hypothetical protein
LSRMFASDKGAKWATSDITGKRYNADRRTGLYNVDNPKDVRAMKKVGWVLAGNTPRTDKHWVCDDCNWDAWINSCPKCGSVELRRVEGDE